MSILSGKAYVVKAISLVLQKKLCKCQYISGWQIALVLYAPREATHQGTTDATPQVSTP